MDELILNGKKLEDIEKNLNVAKDNILEKLNTFEKKRNLWD